MTKEQVARIERLLLFQAEMLHLMQADMQLSVNSSLHKNSKGETPVFRWVGPGRYQMAQSLLGNGAQPVPRAPPATGDGGTYADRAFEILKRTPGAGFGVMASELYGQDTADTRHKVRALINNLYKHGKIRSTARGKWEAIVPSG